MLHRHLQNTLGDFLRHTLEGLRGTTGRDDRIEPELLVRHVVSTFILVLDSWVEAPEPISAERGDQVFRALIMPTLEAVLGARRTGS